MEQNRNYIKNEIKDIINEKNFCLVFDTNIYLNLYEYSPEVTEFFISLSEIIQENIIIPGTVKREFERNHNTCLSRQRRKFQNVLFILNKPLNQMKAKIGKQFDILKEYKFPDIEKIKTEVEEEIQKIEDIFEEYSIGHNILDQFNNKFLDEDKIKNFINKCVLSKKLLKEFTVDEIYLLCAEGERRYKNEIPPGYKDAANKTGVQAYGDFLIWKEILRYCKESKQNLIFVTDDVKEDWFELKNSERIGFRKELINEFKSQTSMNVIGITSNELFSTLADIYNKDVPTTVEWILGYDVQNYVKQIVDWGIIGDIVGELINSGDKYVDTSTLTDYDGSQFEINDELINDKLISYEFEGYYEGEAVYLLVFEAEIEAYSQSYWGRDDETKDIILSDVRTHILKGEITVKVTRKIESYLDDLANDISYSNIEIIEGDLCEESSYAESELCVECGKKVGQYQNYDGEPICYNCMVVNEEGDICTMCGRKVPYEYIRGDCICIECSQEHDL